MNPDGPILYFVSEPVLGVETLSSVVLRVWTMEKLLGVPLTHLGTLDDCLVYTLTSSETAIAEVNSVFENIGWRPMNINIKTKTKIGSTKPTNWIKWFKNRKQFKEWEKYLLLEMEQNLLQIKMSLQ